MKLDEIPRQSGPEPAFGWAAGELRRLALQSSHYLGGLVGTLAVGLVSFPIFARIFPVAEYGMIDLGQKVVLLLWSASKMGLQNAALRFYNRQQFAECSTAAKRYYSTMFFGVMATAAAGSVVYLLAVVIAPASFRGSALGSLTLVIALVVWLRALAAILYAFLRIQERTAVYNAALVGTKVALVTGVCALVPWAGRTARTYFVALSVVEIGVVAALGALALRGKVLAPSHFDRTLFRAGIAFGVPLVVYECAFALLASTDRFFVRHYLGSDALGVYSVAYALAQHVNDVLLIPLGMALTPMYLRLWHEQGSEKTARFLALALDVFVFAAAGILAVGAACAQDAVVVLASAKYAAAGRLVPVMLTGLLIYTTHVILAAGLLIHKRTVTMAGVLLGSVAVNMALNMILLPRLGLMGSAIAGVVSYSVCVIALGSASRRLLALTIDPSSIGKYVAAAVIACLSGMAVNIQSPVLSASAKALVAGTIYISLLLLIDARCRGVMSTLYRNGLLLVARKPNCYE